MGNAAATWTCFTSAKQNKKRKERVPRVQLRLRAIVNNSPNNGHLFESLFIPRARCAPTNLPFFGTFSSLLVWARNCRDPSLVLRFTVSQSVVKAHWQFMKCRVRCVPRISLSVLGQSYCGVSRSERRRTDREARSVSRMSELFVSYVWVTIKYMQIQTRILKAQGHRVFRAVDRLSRRYSAHIERWPRPVT